MTNLLAQMLSDQQSERRPSLDDMADGPAISYMTPAGLEMQKMQQAQAIAAKLDLANALMGLKGIQNPSPFGDIQQPSFHTPFNESWPSFRPSTNIEDRTGWLSRLFGISR